MGFGKRVIGPEAAARQAAKKKGKAGFGPRVIGVRESNKQPVDPAQPTPVAAKPTVVKTPKTVPETVPAGVPATVESLSIEQVQAILAENPAFIETVFVQELERAEGPRRDALLAIRKVAEEQGLTDIVSEADGLMQEQGMAPEVKSDAPVVETPEGDKSITIPTDFNELKVLAKEHGVDLSIARSKVDITAALVKALGEKGITVAAE